MGKLYQAPSSYLTLLKRREKPLRSKNLGVQGTASDKYLDVIKAVVKGVEKPSWLSTVPSDFGRTRTGTLKADEWRAFATIYLPIALVLLWGEGSKHSSLQVAAARRAILDHTMYLVQALSLACYRTTTDSRIQNMHRHLSDYLRCLSEVHKDARPTLNHHMSLHLSKYLKLFGPVHSWWSYPFERLIGRLQHMPTNHKFGECILRDLSGYARPLAD